MNGVARRRRSLAAGSPGSTSAYAPVRRPARSSVTARPHAARAAVEASALETICYGQSVASRPHIRIVFPTNYRSEAEAFGRRMRRELWDLPLRQGGPELQEAGGADRQNHILYSSLAFRENAERLAHHFREYGFGSPRWAPQLRNCDLAIRTQRFPPSTLPAARLAGGGIPKLNVCSECGRLFAVPGSSHCYQCGRGR